MFNTQDNTLNELYFFIDKIKDRLTHDEINELTDIYNNLTTSIEETENLEYELIEYDEKEQLYFNHIDQTKDDIENLFDRWNEEKPLHELMDKVSEIVERDFDIKKKENNNQALQENEILKMVKQGYKFVSGLGAEIYNNYIMKMEKEKIKQQKENEYKILKKSIPLPNASIKNIGENVYSIRSYQVEATVNLETEKVTGKGARGFKNEIIERVKFFINYEQDLAI